MQNNGTEVTRAGFGPRAAAYIIDSVLLAVVLCFVRLPAFIVSLAGGADLSFRAFLFQYSFIDVLCWVLTAVYFVLLTWLTGSTLGKKVMRLRVEAESGEPLRFIDVLYRETVGRFLSGILCLGYLMILADRDNRAFHDWLCATRVVYEGVAFRPKQPRHAAEYSVPGTPAAAQPEEALPAPEYSVPSAAAPVRAEEIAFDPGYSVPGAAAPDMTRPFPAEEPAGND